MSRLIETIRLEDGRFGNLLYHQQRLDATMRALFLNYDSIDVQSILSQDDYPERGLYKCRVSYDSHLHTIQYEPYTIRPVVSLKRIELNDISYGYKFADREELKEAFNNREECDDVLIIKDGLVTDTSYANIVFQNKNNEWITPSTYLLKGTMRQYLLEKGRIKERLIRSTDILSFKRFKLINSMLRWDSAERDISNIV